MKRISCFTVFLAVLLTGPGLSANHYVRQGATGNGSDWTNAYGQLPATLVRGDVYYLADGTYPGRTFSTAANGSTPITIKKAIASDHGTDTGWDASYGDGTALFTGTISFTTSYWVLDGQTGGGPGGWKTGFGIKVEVKTASVNGVSLGGSQVTIRHVEVEGNGGDGDGGLGGGFSQDLLSFGPETNLTVSYAYIHNAGRCLVFGGSSRQVVIEYVYGGRFESTSGQHAEIASIWNTSGQSVQDWTFRYDIFTHAEGTGGIIYEGDDLKIYGCVFAPLDGNSLGGGNGVIGTWSASAMTNVKIYNNTFINTGAAVVGVTGTAGAPVGEFKNNIIYRSTVGGGLGRFTRSHNHYVEPVLSWDGSTDDGGTQTTGTGDPFVNYPGLDFGLKVATAAGAALAAPYNVDPLGNTRGADGGWDRGTFEFTSTDIAIFDFRMPIADCPARSNPIKQDVLNGLPFYNLLGGCFSPGYQLKTGIYLVPAGDNWQALTVIK